MDKKTASQMIQEILNDPCASNWLKLAVRALIQRDPVDAAADAAYLSALMNARCAEILSTPVHP